MLPFNNGLRRRSNEDKVMFKNVQKRYKYPNIISVEYILSHKVKTSPSDYIGIYPRGWNHLRQFAGGDFTKHMPCNESNLYRSLQITCEPPAFNPELNRDYQFVYVNQLHEVLGRSPFFQFVLEDDINLSQWQECGSINWYGVSNGEFPNVKATPPLLQDINVEGETIQLSPNEVAYNECFFKSNGKDEKTLTPANLIGTMDIMNETAAACFLTPVEACRAVNEVSNACSNPKDEPYQNPRRRRALVKTRDNDYHSVTTGNMDFQHAIPESLESHNKNYFTLTGDQGGNTGFVHSHSRTLHEPSILQFESSSDRNGVGCGAIPKKCSKCQAPFGYHYKEQLMQHMLDQAKEQIRDLERNLLKAKQDLELSQAAHAAVKSFNIFRNLDDARCDDVRCDDMRAALNLLTSILAQCGPHVFKTLMLVLQNLAAHGGLVSHGHHKQPFPVRRVVSGREKYLKAIIGQQEEKIQFLIAKLLGNHKVLEAAGLENYDVSMQLSDVDKQDGIKSSQITPKQMTTNDSTFGLADVQKALKIIEKDVANQSSPAEEELETAETTLNPQDTDEDLGPWKNALIVEPKFFQLDVRQTLNHEVVSPVDDASETCPGQHVGTSKLEANNNNFVTKNLNCDMVNINVKVPLHEPTQQGI